MDIFVHICHRLVSMSDVEFSITIEAIMGPVSSVERGELLRLIHRVVQMYPYGYM